MAYVFGGGARAPPWWLHVTLFACGNRHQLLVGPMSYLTTSQRAWCIHGVWQRQTQLPRGRMFDRGEWGDLRRAPPLCRCSCCYDYAHLVTCYVVSCVIVFAVFLVCLHFVFSPGRLLSVGALHEHEGLRQVLPRIRIYIYIERERERYRYRYMSMCTCVCIHILACICTCICTCIWYVIIWTCIGPAENPAPQEEVPSA